MEIPLTSDKVDYICNDKFKFLCDQEEGSQKMRSYQMFPVL